MASCVSLESWVKQKEVWKRRDSSKTGISTDFGTATCRFLDAQPVILTAIHLNQKSAAHHRMPTSYRRARMPCVSETLQQGPYSASMWRFSAAKTAWHIFFNGTMNYVLKEPCPEWSQVLEILKNQVQMDAEICQVASADFGRSVDALNPVMDWSFSAVGGKNNGLQNSPCRPETMKSAQTTTAKFRKPWKQHCHEIIWDRHFVTASTSRPKAKVLGLHQILTFPKI